MSAYYNEIDPFAAQWLRSLIAAGHISPGDVDERSIEDVRPDDLRGYTQCHFFAGVGVWSYALRLAGWPDERPVWTGSCPCQPFSAAGKGAGFADERHLWPHWHWLIQERRPAIILGEQVAAKAVEPWIDLVHADLEALDYAFGCVPFPSAGVGAPHIRDRAYWVADAHKQLGRQGRSFDGRRYSGGNAQSRAGLGGRGMPDELANTNRDGRNQAGQRIAATGRDGFVGDCAAGWLAHSASAGSQGREHTGQRIDAQLAPAERGGSSGRLADAFLQQRSDWQPGINPVDDETGRIKSAAASAGLRSDLRAGPVNGFWRDADWLSCRDGKWRPVEPGTFPLADGAPARVGRLRAYGNAINAQAARVFIEAVMEIKP